MNCRREMRHEQTALWARRPTAIDTQEIVGFPYNKPRLLILVIVSRDPKNLQVVDLSRLRGPCLFGAQFMRSCHLINGACSTSDPIVPQDAGINVAEL